MKALWHDVVEEIMRYVTLEGRYIVINTYHFLLLNHYRHKKWISFLYYLLMSLDSGIKDHMKNPRNPVLHVGLILLIYEHVKFHEVQKSLVSLKEDIFKPREGYETVSEEERVIKKSKKQRIILNKESESDRDDDVDYVPDSYASFEEGPNSPILGKTGKRKPDDKEGYTTCNDEVTSNVHYKGVKDKNELYGEASSPPPTTRQL